MTNNYFEHPSYAPSGLVFDDYMYIGLYVFFVITFLWYHNRSKVTVSECNEKVHTQTEDFIGLDDDFYIKRIEELEMMVKELTVEKYRSYDNIIDLYKRNNELTNKNTKQQERICHLEYSCSRIKSLRNLKRRMVSNPDASHGSAITDRDSPHGRNLFE